MSQILFVSAPEGYDSDALRRAAYDCAVSAGETGVCLVQASTPSMSSPAQVVVNIAAKEASIVLALPTEERETDFGPVYVFRGDAYLVTDLPGGEAIAQDPFDLQEAGRSFILTLDRETAFLTTLQYDRTTGEMTPVRRTVEGAAAAAMYLHRDLEQGTMEVTIEQPGGVLEIGMRKESGKVTGLSAGGPVEV